MMLNILYHLRNAYLIVTSYKLSKKLLQKKEKQIKDFNNIQKEYGFKYDQISNIKENKYMVESWRDNNKKLAQSLLPFPKINFLRNPIIMRTMFVASGGRKQLEQLNYLESKIPKKKLKVTLEEDLVGYPLLSNSKYLTSHNNIHHLYHLAKFVDNTGYQFRNNQTVIEWGGGYGNFAKIVKKYNKGLKLTYIIIDSSLFSCLQWLYLSSIFGLKEVFLITNKNNKIRKGKINIIPLGYLKYFQLKADLFVSTWALSESNKYSQEIVINSNWFCAKAILISFQKSSKKFPHADSLGNLLKSRGGSVKEITFLPGNYYGYLNSGKSK